MSNPAQPFNVWEGVYPTFGEAPVVGLGFDDPFWRSSSSSAARAAQADLVAGRPLDASLQQRNSVLAAVCATLLATKSRIRILDFGGGPAFGFLVLQAAIPDAVERVDYHIVEVAGVCEEAARMFDGHVAPTFHTTLPEARDFDIIFTASAIQYIADWKSICQRLAAFRAPYLLFSDLYAGEAPAFTTLQRYYESRIAHWMLNEREFVAVIEAAGYAMRLRTPCNVKILGVDGDAPMTNFPLPLRIKNSKHMLFALEK